MKAKKIIFFIIVTAAAAAGGKLAGKLLAQSAFQQDFNEYGLRRPMTEQEFAHYNQCQDIVKSLPYPTAVQGREMTIPEALGPALTKSMCACTAIRLRTANDTFPAVWASCAQTVIGG